MSKSKNTQTKQTQYTQVSEQNEVMDLDNSFVEVEGAPYTVVQQVTPEEVKELKEEVKEIMDDNEDIISESSKSESIISDNKEVDKKDKVIFKKIESSAFNCPYAKLDSRIITNTNLRG